MTETEFVDLSEKLRPELVKIAGRRCGRDYAEDAVQKSVTQLWEAGKWKSYLPERVAGLLRQAASRKGINELRSLGRFRALQKETSVLLGNSGCRHTPSAPNSDGDETK